MKKIQKIVEVEAPPPIPPLALSVEEAAQAVGVCPNTMRALIADGTVRVIRVGRKIIVPVMALEEWLRGAP